MLVMKERSYRALFFPGIVFFLYVFLLIVAPEKAFMALKCSSLVFLRISLPLFLVFILMLMFNLYLKPADIARFIGKRSGIKGKFISASAGIISVGPIYAWYPLLKDLKEKGASNDLIAIFLSNRAIKPFLLPVMVSYFGWTYVGILTVFTIIGSLAVGQLIQILIKD
jgi:uncharacterized membrane protein YraQ (UPF0718 family)